MKWVFLFLFFLTNHFHLNTSINSSEQKLLVQYTIVSTILSWWLTDTVFWVQRLRPEPSVLASCHKSIYRPHNQPAASHTAAVSTWSTSSAAKNPLLTSVHCTLRYRHTWPVTAAPTAQMSRTKVGNTADETSQLHIQELRGKWPTIAYTIQKHQSRQLRGWRVFTGYQQLSLDTFISKSQPGKWPKQLL